MKTLVLASKSPRRKELLEKANLSFHTFSVKVSEFLNKNISLDKAIQQIARQKAMACVEHFKSLNSLEKIVLASDTLVVLKEEVLGKPLDEGQAFEFLSRLSGQTHEVKTAYCFIDVMTDEEVMGLDRAFVTFRKISKEEIWDYIKTGDPMDKAGAYGIQNKEFNFIENLDGEMETVMGLPIKKILEVIKENGWDFFKK